MYHLANGVKTEHWKKKSSFLKDYNMAKKGERHFTEDFLSVWNVCSKYEKEKSVEEVFTEYPYLIFTDENFLYDEWWILKVISYDAFIFSAMLEVEDDTLHQIIYNERMIKNAVGIYHSVIDFEWFEKDILFMEIIEEDEMFLYSYFTVMYEEMLHTKKGILFYLSHYKSVSDSMFYRMVDWLVKYSKMEEVQMLYEMRGLEYEYWDSKESGYPQKQFPLTSEEVLDLERQFGFTIYTNDDEEMQNQFTNAMIELLEKEEYEKLHSIIHKLDESILMKNCKYNIANEKMVIYENKYYSYAPNFKFYIDCAKKGYPMLLESEWFANNYSMWMILLSHNPQLICFVPKALLCDSDFVLHIRYFCEDVLLYCAPCLLENERFMLEYLYHFKTTGYFKLGKTLQRDVVFLKTAKALDEHILFYIEEA